MNKISIAFAGLLGAAAISAQGGELYTPEQYQSTASASTRAQVRQSVLQARRTGELNHNDIDLPAAGTTEFGKTRASVKSEVLAARATGGLQHDDVDLPAVATGARLTRQQVRDDNLASRNSVRTAPGRNTIDY